MDANEQRVDAESEDHETEQMDQPWRVKIIALSGTVVEEVEVAEICTASVGLVALLAPRAAAKMRVDVSRLRFSLSGRVLDIWDTWHELGEPRELQLVVLPFCNDFKDELLEAVSGQDLDQVNQVLGRLQDPNARSRDHVSAFMKASILGQPEIMVALYGAGADVDAEDLAGLTALHCAVRDARLETVRLLLNLRSNVDARNKLGRTPLFEAVSTGCVAMVQALATAAADPDSADRDGGTPLRAAVAGGFLEAVEILVNALTSANDLSTTIAVKTAWENYIQQQNDLSGLGANKAFQVSSLWVNVEAQDGIIRSTVTTITSAIFIGYLAAVIFTQDLVLSLFPMLSVGLTVLCLLFMMVGVLQWPFGPVDVISLIVFLGYMFTFNLHVAQYYNHAEVALDLDEDGTIDPADEAERKQDERYCRVNHALASVGQSLIFSAGTTTASAIFLLCCVLQFFVKFGAVILSVTVLSILHSLIFLPALLLICGPTSKSCMCLKKVCRKLRQKVAPAEAVEPAQATAQGETEECMSPPPLPPPAVRPDAEPVGGTEPASPLNSYIRQMDSHEEEV